MRLTSIMGLTMLALAGETALAGMPEPVASVPMASGDKADAPNGFYDMCRREKAVCLALGGVVPDADPAAEELALLAVPATDPEVAGGHPQLRRLVHQINRSVNRTVAQISDFDALGKSEVWQRAGAGQGAFGDCEDIALEKRLRLLDAGFPAEKLFFAIAYSRKTGMHTVLVARLDNGDFVLDNLTDRITRWTETPYNFVRRQSVDDPLVWHRVNHDAVRAQQLASAAIDQKRGQF